jgi:NAD(P)-dependent dehydrogenase (short-subunit alcohol dehydrogenase family)
MKPPVPSLAGRLCVITGAASGIGRATARRAAREGARLVLTDVRAEDLDAVAQELGDAVVAYRALDITDVDAVRAFADDVHAAHGSADVVMNIAGIATWGAVERLSHEQWRRTVDVNLMGPIHVIESFVPAMVAARRGGQLVNVSSAAGLMGLPWHAPYSATKFGLRGVSEVLRFDLRRHRIGVTLVCPGGVDTGLTSTVDVAGVDREHPHMRKWTERFRRHAISPERAAEKILEGVVGNRYLVFTSNDIRFFHAAQRYLPHTYAFVMQRVNNRFVAELERATTPGPAPTAHAPRR